MDQDPWYEDAMERRREVSGEGLEAEGQGPDGEDYVPFTNPETEKAYAEFTGGAQQGAVCQCCGQPLPAD